MIVLSLCYEDSCSYDFSNCASLHHSSFHGMIFALIPLKGVVRNSVLLLGNPCNAHVHVYKYTAHIIRYSITSIRACTLRVNFVQ